MLTLDDCSQAIDLLHTNYSRSSPQITVDKGGSFAEVLPLSGLISNIPLDSKPAVYEVDCMEPSCFENDGIWSYLDLTRYRPRQEPYRPIQAYVYEDGCYSDECFEHYRPTCIVTKSVPSPCCYEVDVYDPGAFQLVPRTIIEYANPLDGPCYVTPLDDTPQDIPRGESLYRAGMACTKYVLEAGEIYQLPPYTPDNFDPLAYTPASYVAVGGEEWLVCEGAGPYEPCVYEEPVYEHSWYVYAKDLSPACFDTDIYETCVYDGWDFWGVWGCHPLALDIPRSLPCIERVEYDLWRYGRLEVGNLTLRAVYLGVYEPDVFDALVYEESWHIYADTPIGTTLLAIAGANDIHYASPLGEYEGLLAYILPYRFEALCVSQWEPTDYQWLGVASTLLRQYHCAVAVESYIISVQCVECHTQAIGPYATRWQYLNGQWLRQYFVQGAGSSDTAYTVDVGILQPICMGQPSLVEYGIPVRSDGRFTSRSSLPIGLKYVRLNRHTAYTVEVVAEYWGGYLLPRTYESPRPLGYYDINQYVDVKSTLIGMLVLLISPYQPVAPCERVFGYRPPYFMPEVARVLTHLWSLVYQGAGDRQGTLPSRVRPHSTYDELYYPPQWQCLAAYEPGVFHGGCMDDPYWNDDLMLTDDQAYCAQPCYEPSIPYPKDLLAVDNETVAWLVYVTAIYMELDNSYQAPLMELTINYLRGSIDSSNGLLLAGMDVFGQTIAQHPFRTNMVASIALLKAYDVLDDLSYLQSAISIHMALEGSLYDHNNRVYVESYDSQMMTTSSLIYGLWYSYVLNKVESIEASLVILQSRGRPYRRRSGPLMVQGATVTTYSGSVLSVSGDIYSDPLPFYTEPLTTEDSYCLWALINLVTPALARDGYKVNYQPLLTRAKDEIRQGRLHGGVINYSLCMISDEGVDHPYAMPRSVPELEKVIFHYALTFDKLKNLWPVDFTTWANKSSLKRGNILGSLLYTLATSISIWYGLYHTKRADTYLMESTNRGMDSWGGDLDLTRRLGEQDLPYKQRLAYVLGRSIDSRELDIIALAEHWGYPATIDYLPMQSTLSYQLPSHFSPQVGSYLQDGDARKAIYHLYLEGPVEPEAYKWLQRATAGGILGRTHERISLPPCPLPTPKFYIGAWKDYGIPSAIALDVCCSDSTVTLTLNAEYPYPVYVWQIGDAYEVGASLPIGVKAIGLFKPGQISMSFLARRC